MRHFILAASLVLTASGAAAQTAAPSTQTLQMDSDHATVTATMSSANARFGIVAGALQYSPTKPEESTIALSFDTSSIEEKPARDAFDADHFPEVRISSSAIARKSGGGEALPTMVTIRNITKPVVFQVTFTKVAADVIAMHAEGTVHSADFKMSGKGGTIQLVIDAPFNRVGPER
ncbi:MAG TPA: YceI family protein [Rhizomicrobium sp.]|nr:YceI family protein [Rhizomicrobium sp.]